MRSFNKAFVLPALAVLACVATGCKEEKNIIYSERFAILPDATGFLLKEVHGLPDGRTQLVLVESVNGKSPREICAVPLPADEDVKFHFQVGGDSLYLYHTHQNLAAAIQAGLKEGLAFPVLSQFLPNAKWLATGTEEGAAVLYAPDKWKMFLELSRPQ